MRLNTRIITTLAFCAVSSGLFAQEKPAEPRKIKLWEQQLENLAPEKKESYRALLMDSKRLFDQKRIFEALNALYEAEAIHKDNPLSLNLKGACYVEFRDFDLARACFDQALLLSPKNPHVLFNLAEVDFVTNQWKWCEQRVIELMPLIDEKNIPLRRLLEFKLLLSHLKTDQLEKARVLSEKYDFLDDSPYYYYANASMAYQSGDAEKAEGWIASAQRVFRDPQVLAPWKDTLIEFGYIKSFYGNHLDPNASEDQP